jgi:hypothetical protein
MAAWKTGPRERGEAVNLAVRAVLTIERLLDAHTVTGEIALE